MHLHIKDSKILLLFSKWIDVDGNELRWYQKEELKLEDRMNIYVLNLATLYIIILLKI